MMDIPRPPQQPGLHDTLRFSKSRRPEPRMPGKHALNPPIVTVLGAGIAGLTAAHELVERGFLVQVVESEQDPYCPGRPLVGGMAANQPARIRANVEDLHQGLLDLAAKHLSQNVDEKEHKRSLVAKCIVELCAFNRRTWLTTEFPARVRRVLYTTPDTDNGAFTKAVIRDLEAARKRYRTQWIWDLVIRSVLVGDITPNGKPADLLRFAQRVFETFNEQKNTEDMAALLHWINEDEQTRDLDFNEYVRDLLVPALEREFLCFRLLARSRRGFEKAPADARTLYRAWSERLRKEFPHSCVSNLDEQKVAVVIAEAPPRDPLAADDGMMDELQNAWLELEIIEQRLPGEHGFRFFPSFYRHIDDTMRRIPLFESGRPVGRTVLDNLSPTLFQGIGFSQADKHDPHLKGSGELGWDNRDEPEAQPKQRGIVVPLNRDLPRSIEGLRDRTDRLVKRMGGTTRDAVLLFSKLFRFMTTSPERRRKTYEGIAWSTFLNVDQFSPAMRKQIDSAAQVLVAFSVTHADARTYGNVAIQLLFDQLKDASRVDRILNGPTSDAWLEPWREYLERQGVRFFCREVAKLDRHDDYGVVPIFTPERAKDDEKEPAIVSQDGYRLLTHKDGPGLSPDFYVLATNFETAHDLIEPLLKEGDEADEKRAPDFYQMHKFWSAVENDGLKFMTGVQFFFDAKTSLGRGHMYFPLSRWGLSSISQSEFWSRRGGFADGYFGVLSVGICDPGEDVTKPKPGDFWTVLERGTNDVRRLNDWRANRYSAARTIWQQIGDRIDKKDELGEPRCFHIDQKLDDPDVEAQRNRRAWDPVNFSDRRYPRFARFLASLAIIDRERPGRDPGQEEVAGEKEIEYSINYDRWVLCSTYMATHTRLTTMDAANESARHAVKAILTRMSEPEAIKVPDKPIALGEHTGSMKSLAKTMYNGTRRVYDHPDVFNPEDHEFEDLDIFRRIDRRLLKLGLDHFLDIIQFDKKLLHALEAVNLYGDVKPLGDVIKILASSLDAVFLSEFGRTKRAELVQTAGKLGSHLPNGLLAELETLLEQLKGLAKG